MPDIKPRQYLRLQCCSSRPNILARLSVSGKCGQKCFTPSPSSSLCAYATPAAVGGVLAERLHLHSQLSLVRSALALLRRPLHLARRLHLVHAQRKLQECPHRQCSCQRVDRRPALRQPDCPGQHGLRWSHVRSIPPASRAPASVINGLSAAAYTHSFSSSPSSASLPKSTAINKAVWAPAVCRFWPLANRKPSLSIHGSLVPSSCHDGKSLSVPFVAPGKSLKTRCASYLYIVVHLQ